MIRLIPLVLLLLAVGCTQPPDALEMEDALNLAEAMGGDTLGYARAVGPTDFDFPSDFGAHTDFKTEWWYFTGNLRSEDDRRFGYEFTLFRSALHPPDSLASPSDWSTNQLYMGHFSLADPETGTFHAFERFSRGAAGLAGAESPPFRVWLEDWTMESMATDPSSLFPLRLQVAEEEVAIDLTLDAVKPMVLQGDRGWDPKGEGNGNASYYFSFTRIGTSGTVTLPSGQHDVEGTSWKDHEWSTSALGDDEVGWDWFALQLDDGREIMFYQLRREDGSQSPFTGGTLVIADGSYRHITRDEMDLRVEGQWESPVSGAVYPSGWTLTLPGEDLTMRVTPVMPNQELNVSVRYFEGAIDVEGTSKGQPITGVGYVELTGYDRPAS
jgi:predicted secreted hydrolase